MAGNDTTLLQMKTRAIDLADMTASAFPVDARLMDYANDGLEELYDILANTFDDYVKSEQTITVTAGTEEYALNADFYKLIKLYYVTGNRRYPVKRYNMDQIGGYRNSPLSSGSVEMWYIPMCPLFTADGDKVSDKVPALPVGWEKYIVYHMAAQLLGREESDTTRMDTLKEKERLKIVGAAEPRDANEPDAISDVSGRWESARYYCSLEKRQFRYRLMGANISFIEVEYAGA